MVMTNTEIACIAAKEEIATISKQAMGLATGLQNVAPAASGASNSIVYLMETANQLTAIGEQLEDFFPSEQGRSGI